MTSSDAMHSPAPFGPDPYTYLPKVPSFQLTIAGQTLARATLVCPTPASA